MRGQATLLGALQIQSLFRVPTRITSLTMNATPKSGYEKVGGMMYFPRMLDKIRLHARGELRPDFHANLIIGADGFCTGFLHVAYADLRNRALAYGTDEEILRWCFENGRRLN